MSDLRVAKRYVAGLIKVAEEHKVVDAVEQTLQALHAALGRSSELAMVLEHPTIPRARKKQLLHDVLPQEASALVVRFLDYVIDKKREKILPLLSDEFKQAADALRGMVRGRIRSATALTQGQIERLGAELSGSIGKKVEFEIEQDPSLLGGLQVYIGTYVIDGSVTGRLNRFHKHLLDEV
ncbi:MAG: ATP synthase F1 subunit delta, partial [Deltaproteobacteria bacterium]|nr:ATP synthase F1 subunit delta [Deltaproteobacteria bacterium]